MQTYRENERLQMEVKNMWILQEENKDLREDLDRLQKTSYDQKVKDMQDENQTLRKRNGALLVENEQFKAKIKELEQKLTMYNIEVIQQSKKSGGLIRP